MKAWVLDEKFPGIILWAHLEEKLHKCFESIAAIFIGTDAR